MRIFEDTYPSYVPSLPLTCRLARCSQEAPTDAAHAQPPFGHAFPLLCQGVSANLPLFQMHFALFCIFFFYKEVHMHDGLKVPCPLHQLRPCVFANAGESLLVSD